MTRSQMHPIPISEVRRTFLAFREQCIWLQTCYNTFNVLFDGGQEVDSLLRKSAPIFFSDLNTILVEYWIVLVCRLTDTASTGRNDNLTVRYLLQALKQNSSLTPEIECLAAEIQDYRSLINEARNKLVAQSDRNAFLAGRGLGEHTETELVSFIRSLQAFNDLVGNALGEGPLDYQVTSGPGDAYDLLRALRCST